MQNPLKNLQESFFAKLVEMAEKQSPGVVLFPQKGVLKISQKLKENT